METNKEVTIQIRVDKKVSDALKKEAKDRDYRFSAYVRRILINSLDKEKKQEQE